MARRTTRVEVDLKSFEKELFSGLGNNRHLRRALNDFIDDTHDLWKKLAPSPTGAPAPKDRTVRERYATYQRVKGQPGHPYSTGDYKRSIKKRNIDLHARIKTSIKQAVWKGTLIGSVYTDDENALRIEYGTGPDSPDSRSPWGSKTSTPEFAPMRKTFARMKARRRV